MQRKALIVSGAAGPHDVANGVLQRFGFGAATPALNLAEATAKLHTEHFDLVVVPLQGVGSVELATLEREVRARPNSFLIGTAVQADPDLILRAMRSGIHEFLVYPPDAKDFAAAVDRLLRRQHTEGKTGAVLAVYSAKGGLGTTSVAVNLAFAIAKAHADSRVALVDLVAGGGDLRVMLDLKAAYDMGDLLQKADRIDAELLQSIMTATSGGVWALPSSEDPEVADQLDATVTSTIIAQLRSRFTYTVLDCEHHLNECTVTALDVADRIVLVTQLNLPALRSTQRTLGLFTRLGYGDDKIHVVVNRYGSGDVVTLRDASDVLKREIFYKIPNDYRAVSAAVLKGMPIAEHDRSSALASSFAVLASRLAGKAEQPERSNGHQSASRIGRLFGRGRK